MQNHPGERPLSQHLFDGPQKSLQTPIATSQVMHFEHSAFVWQGGVHDAPARQTWPA
jgi:hypothetical protein